MILEPGKLYTKEALLLLLFHIINYDGINPASCLVKQPPPWDPTGNPFHEKELQSGKSTLFFINFILFFLSFLNKHVVLQFVLQQKRNLLLKGNFILIARYAQSTSLNIKMDRSRLPDSKCQPKWVNSIPSKIHVKHSNITQVNLSSIWKSTTNLNTVQNCK